MIIDPTTLSSMVLVLTGFSAAFVVALWVSLIIWTYRDLRSRSKDLFLRILAMLLVGILFLPGLLVYMILRPPRTLEEEYQRSLEEESLLQTIEDNMVCPGCSRRIHEDWIVCPNCYTKLRKTCHICGKSIDLAWNMCPYCGTPAPGMRRENVTVDDTLARLTGETND